MYLGINGIEWLKQANIEKNEYIQHKNLLSL